MKSLSEQALEFLKKDSVKESDEEDVVGFLRGYYSETHLRINSMSGVPLTKSTLAVMAGAEETSRDSLSWLWAADDDEFLLANHVSECLDSCIKQIKLVGFSFKVTQKTSPNGVRIWGVKVNSDVFNVDATFDIFDVRGVKALIHTLYEAYCDDTESDSDAHTRSSTA